MNFVEEVKILAPNAVAIRDYILLSVNKQLKEKNINTNYVDFVCLTPTAIDDKVRIEYQTIFWEEVEYIRIAPSKEMVKAIDLLIKEIVVQVVCEVNEEVDALDENILDAIDAIQNSITKQSERELVLESRDDNQSWEIYELDENKTQVVYATIFKNGQFIIKDFYDVYITPQIVEFASVLKDKHEVANK